MFRSIPTIALMLLLLIPDLAGGWSRGAEPPLPEPFVSYNLAADHLYPPAVLDSLLALEQVLPTSRRIGLWARRFLADPDSEYLFGLKEGGYVAQGLIQSDHKQDCVSLIYRCSELARARDHLDALELALRTRFAGADIDRLIDRTGRVDYECPEHLDFSLDMIRSGLWGEDVSGRMSGVTIDSLGTARYPAHSFSYIDETTLEPSELREGDLVWLVLNPTHQAGGRLRRDYGIAIGHLGIIIVEGGRPWLVHAASSDLDGWYEGGKVVRVPVEIYLQRVERYCGLMVTRFPLQVPD